MKTESAPFGWRCIFLAMKTNKIHSLSVEEFLHSVKVGYEQGCERYAEKWLDQKTHHVYDFIEEDLKTFENYLTPGCTLLDIGCASGDDCTYFADKGYRVTGIDFSPKSIELAKKKYPALEFLEWDILELRKMSRQFDAVWCAFSLLHLPTDLFEEGLIQVKACMHPSAIMYLAMSTASVSTEEITDVITTDKTGQPIGIPIVRWNKHDLQNIVNLHCNILSQRDFKIETRDMVGFILQR